MFQPFFCHQKTLSFTFIVFSVGHRKKSSSKKATGQQKKVKFLIDLMRDKQGKLRGGPKTIYQWPSRSKKGFS